MTTPGNKRSPLQNGLAAPRRQTGATLLIGLMILLVLVILGLTSSNVSMMQERMAGNFRESNLAFQAAEDTLREIEMRLQGTGGGTGGLGVIPSWSDDASLEINDCTLQRRYGPTSSDDWDDAPWQEAPTADDTNPSRWFMIIDLRDQPACRPMEEEDGTPRGAYFLIVARALGPGGAGDARRAEAVLQSMFFWP